MRSDALTFLPSQLLADFDQLWTFVRDHYCFFDEKKVVWERVRERFRPRVAGLSDGIAFARVVAASLDELYDLHSHLNFHLDDEPRTPGHDVWAEWRGERAVVVDVRRPSAAYEALSFRTLDDGTGYIAIRSFAERDLVARFDRALDALRATRGMVIDVRNNGGGNTALARPIMGRFVTSRTQYAWMARREGGVLGRRWTEFVEPRGPWTYAAPVVTLTNHWSASMAEGFPMGMHGLHRATIVGTPMMGLGAGVIDATLGWTQLPLQLSAEPVYHVDGTPRWRLRPGVLVDLTTPVSDDDPILAAGLRTLTSSGR